MKTDLKEIAQDILKYDPTLFGTLTEITYGNDRSYKLQRILDWGNQWQTSDQKQKTEKRPPKHS